MINIQSSRQYYRLVILIFRVLYREKYTDEKANFVKKILQGAR